MLLTFQVADLRLTVRPLVVRVLFMRNEKLRSVFTSAFLEKPGDSRDQMLIKIWGCVDGPNGQSGKGAGWDAPKMFGPGSWLWGIRYACEQNGYLEIIKDLT